MAVRVVRLTSLAAPVQDAAVTRLGDRVYAFGGLDAAGASTATISVLRGSTVRSAGRLPVPIHDAAAASSPSGRVYVMGGGQFASASGIARFDPATARTRIVGAFPTPLSDLAVATVGATNYVVGGYTGLRWSNRIYAVRDARVRQVGVLRSGRYAAVAALGNAVVIAGGRTQTGASQAIYFHGDREGDASRDAADRVDACGGGHVDG
jgi:hypothetical protein